MQHSIVVNQSKLHFGVSLRNKNMALVRDIIFKAYPKVAELIKHEMSIVNLKGVNKITVNFDPLRDDVKDIRNFNHLIGKDPAKSNPKCVIKTEILQDRSEHFITFDLIDKKKFIFKCANLTTLEIFQLINKYITVLAPEEEVLGGKRIKLKKK